VYAVIVVPGAINQEIVGLCERQKQILRFVQNDTLLQGLNKLLMMVLAHRRRLLLAV
jgi:hypothetical protein